MNELSIIIPCISSASMLPNFIDELAHYVMSSPSDIDIILVANEKAEFVSQITADMQKKYPWMKFTALQRRGNSRNYGALVRFGIAYSSSHYIALVSSYAENDITIIPEMLAKIRAGAQVVQATRYSHKNDAEKVPFRFRLYQDIYRFFTRILLGFRISDSTYGFKIFDRVFIQAIGLNQNGYSICPEITIKTLLAGGKVEYITSINKSVLINRDFKLYIEGIGYFWLLLRGFMHRIGVLWF